MAITDKYNLETFAYSVTDKSGIATSNTEKLDDHIHTRLIGTFGETIAAYEAVYLKSDGKYWLAQADGTKQPCIGLAIESGVADEQKRVQRVGPITNASWTWTVGGVVYLDPTAPGALTQTKPTSDAQVIGVAESATTMLLLPLFVADMLTESSGQPYIINIYQPGKPSDGWSITLNFSVDVTIPAGLTDAKVTAEEAAATAETIFSVKKNGVEVGTATFAASGSTATLAMASEQSFVAGTDKITLAGPATADATLAGLSWAIKGTR